MASGAPVVRGAKKIKFGVFVRFSVKACRVVTRDAAQQASRIVGSRTPQLSPFVGLFIFLEEGNCFLPLQQHTAKFLHVPQDSDVPRETLHWLSFCLSSYLGFFLVFL
jgi:hypothetical protein